MESSLILIMIVHFLNHWCKVEYNEQNLYCDYCNRCMNENTNSVSRKGWIHRSKNCTTGWAIMGKFSKTIHTEY